MHFIKLQPPSFLKQTTIFLPASKSISNRVLIIKYLSGKDFKIENLSAADDTRLMQKALYEANAKEFNLKNAGTAMRFLTACFAATENKEVILKGEERMYSRPIAPLVEVLKQLGADITYLEKEGFPPLKIKGRKLQGGKVKIPANISSQFVSALLLIAPIINDGLTLCLDGEIVSQPYIKLTLDVLSHFGINSKTIENQVYIKQQHYKPEFFFVESDWSAASYIFALAALFPGTEIKIPNLFKESSQGDSMLKEMIAPFGVKANFEGNNCKIKSNINNKVFVFEKDFIHFPDLIPTFAVLCCVSQIPFQISGTKTLKYKESDRAKALQQELAKLGYHLTVTENHISCNTFPDEQILRMKDEIIILNTYNDHRLAMSFSLLSGKHPNIAIENPTVVEKSYPGFWHDLEKLGFGINYL